MFHVKLLAAAGELTVVGALLAQVGQGPSGTTVVVGLLGIIIALQWQTGRQVAAMGERMKVMATREWTKDLLTEELDRRTEP